MNELIYASGNDANIRYISAFDAPDDFLYFRLGDLQAIVVSALEYSRACSEAKQGIKVFCRDEFPEAANTAGIIQLLAQKYKQRHFMVPDNFPLALARELEQHKITLEIRKPEFFPQRRAKNDGEIAFIRQAMAATAQAMQTALETLRSASVNAKNQLVFENEILTSEKMRFIINCRLLEYGGFSDSTIVAGGIQSSQPHNHGSGALRAHEPIVIDIFPRMDCSAYYGDMTRTFVKGKAPDIVKKAFAAVQQARDEAKKMIKNLVIAADVHNRARDIMTAAGFATISGKSGHEGFIHGLGHGVGLNIHEAPRLSAGVNTPLRTGDVVTVEPGLYYPAWGGIRLEDMVLVRENDCECLTDFETVLEIN